MVDEISQCPECFTSKAVMPNLILRFSSCCGRTLCSDCIEALFKKVKSVACKECNAAIQRTSWQEENLELQRYRTESKLRISRINTTFILSRDDFTSRKEYDDYLELVQDIVCGLMSTDKDEANEAEKRMKSWREDNKIAIERRFRSLHFATDRLASSAAAAVAAEAKLSEGAPAAAAPMMMMVPSVLTGPAPRPILHSGSIFVDLSEKKKQLAILEKLPEGSRPANFTPLAFEVQMGAYAAKTAGGWTPDIDMRRANEEAFALF